jgi:hypothetical protein
MNFHLVKEIIGKKYGSTFISSAGSREWTRVQRSELIGSGEQKESPTENVGDLSSSDEKDDDVPETSSSLHVGHIRALESALNNQAFSSKTRFSQEKYLRKKHQKYAKEITVLKPSLNDFCDANPTEIRGDMLGSLIRFSAVRHGSHVAVVDDVAGVLTASLLLLGCKVDRYVFGRSSGQERGQHMFSVEKSVNLLVMREHDGGQQPRSYDAVVIAHNGTTEFDVRDAFKTLEPSLKLSGSLAIYCRNVEPLLRLFHEIRLQNNETNESRFINVQLTEQMCRELEVVKDRTHPVMQQSIYLFKGFILSGIKVVS